MTLDTTLRLDRLYLHNFRCFGECTIELHPQLTVLVAENGQGKTAVLDAISSALGLFVDTISGTRQYADFNRTDVRLVPDTQSVMRPMLPMEFVADGYIAEQPIHWSRALKSYGLHSRTTTKEAKDLVQAAQQLRARVESYTPAKGDTPPILPLVAFYGTNRLWSEYQPVKKKRRPDMTRMSGYSDCLSSSSSFKSIAGWYEDMMNAARDPRSSSTPDIKRPEKLLAAVRQATRVVLAPTGWSELDWDFEKRLLVVEHPDQGRLPLATLSDGVRNMIALVADIAYRCVSLNPHLSDEAARQTPGVLLIDEVDMHLHPGWQQQVVDLLRQAFPLLQMVLSTHSPHVLSAVNVDSIRVIHLREGDGVLTTPQYQTRGVESADVLARIMNIDPVPHVEEAQWLSDYKALIQQHLFDTPEAETLLAKLKAHFGSDHPVILESERMIRLERFKKTLPPSPSQKQG